MPKNAADCKATCSDLKWLRVTSCADPLPPRGEAALRLGEPPRRRAARSDWLERGAFAAAARPSRRWTVCVWHGAAGRTEGKCESGWTLEDAKAEVPKRVQGGSGALTAGVLVPGAFVLPPAASFGSWCPAHVLITVPESLDAETSEPSPAE
ncbi:hypothetical protein SRHO_G00087570 [Serrasalmus rhombeus]